MKDDRKELNNGAEPVLWFGLVALGFHLYIDLEVLFASFGLTHPMATMQINKLLAGMPGLGHPYWTKLAAGICIGWYSYANRGVKSATLTRKEVLKGLGLGVGLFVGSIPMLGSGWLLSIMGVFYLSVGYLLLTTVGVLYIIKGAQGLNRLIDFSLANDMFNRQNESFPQEQVKIETPYSVNIQTRYTYLNKLYTGWLNISAPFRATMVMGTPGSGKTYGIVNSIIRQHIEKGFSMYIYDWKFPTLSLIAFNAMVRHKKNLPNNLRFYCINFDNPRKSHRCNPLDPSYMPQIDDAFETAKIMMLNMNKSWIGKEGDIWADSAINYTTALLWFLCTYQKGKYCTFPHLVELMTIDYRKIFPIMMANPDLEGYMAMFVSAYNGGAMEMLEGQVNTARTGLARLSSPSIYWAMSANDFTLDINNPKAPKILCMANNSKKKNLYGAAVGLFNARVLNQINTPGQHPCSVVIDELPTIYFQGLSDLIATGRENKIAVTLSLQDFSQAESAYGKAEAESIRNTVGTWISGAVSGQTAKSMEDRIGKNVQRKQSITIQTDDTTHGITTELAPMVPAAKIGQLKSGEFVGVVAGDYGNEGNLKAFNATVVIDEKSFKGEQKVKELPDFSIFAQDGPSVQDMVKENYYLIKLETKKIVEDELARLAIDVDAKPKKTTRKHDRSN